MSQEQEPPAQDTEPAVDSTAGFCRPVTHAEADQWSREWKALRAARQAALPLPPPPVNVALAIEMASIAGDPPPAKGVARYHEFNGKTYRFRPTSYVEGIALLDALIRLGRLEKDLHERRIDFRGMRELRGRYHGVAVIAGRIAAQPSAKPFLGGWGLHYRALLQFLLDTGIRAGGREPVEPEREGRQVPYDAARHLTAYMGAFGATVGMVERGAPASWRHFTAGCTHITRDRALRAISLWEAAAELTPEARRGWLERQREMIES